MGRPRLNKPPKVKMRDLTEKKCLWCKTVKPIQDFPRRGGGRDYWCAPCVAGSPSNKESIWTEKGKALLAALQEREGIK